MLWLWLVRPPSSPAWISSAKFNFKSPDLTWRSSATGKESITFMVRPLPLKNKIFHEYFPCGFTFIYHHAWAKLSNNVFCQSSPKLEVMIMWHFPNRKLTLIKLFFFLTVCRFPIINIPFTTFGHHWKKNQLLRKIHNINFGHNLIGFGCVQLKSIRNGFQH